MRIWSISEDKYGNIWLGTSIAGIIKLIYDKERGDYKRADLGKINVTPNNRNFIVIDNEDRIWIGTEYEGLFQYDEKENHLNHFVKKENDLNSISDNTIYSLYIDRSNVLWIGTFSQGLCKYDLHKKQFQHFKSIPGDKNTLSGNVISSIHSTKSGELWVGVDLEGGINRFIFNDNKEPEVIYYKHNPENSNSIGGNSILCLVQRKNGEVWAGSAGGSISKITPEKYGSHKQPVIKNYNLINWTFCIYEDRQGTIWGGTWRRGFWRYNEKIDTFTFFQNDPDNPSSICDDIIWAITEDTYGNIWIGGHSEGISILPEKEKYKPNPEFINFKHEDGNPQSLDNNTINAFCQGKLGTMWIGTAGGLNKVIRKNNNFSNIDTDNELEFFSYHTKDGLPGVGIVGIVEDNSGNLWLSTSNGISKFNISDNSFTNYDESDGLQSDEFWHNAYFKDQNGRVYFGGNNGFNAFYPDSIKTNSFLPHIVFTDFKLFYKSVEIGEKINNDIIISKSINETSEIVLSHKNNIFSIEFAAMHFAQPDKNRYAYKMEGFDKEWVETSADRRIASYTNLPAGYYTFKVRAANNDGIWNEQGTSIKIIITPPFRQTWWFQLTLLVSILLLILIIHKIRTYQIKKRNRELAIINTKLNAEIKERHRVENKIKFLNKELEQRVKERTEELESFAYSVSHDLRAPLRGMQGFSTAILEDYTDKLDKKGKNYLKRIAVASRHMDQLINDLLNLSRITRKEFVKEKTNLGNIFKKIITNLQTKEPDRNVKITYSEDLIAVCDKNLMKLAIENLVLNAWKFTSKKSRAEIQFGKMNIRNNTVFFIRDNGIGFEMKYADKLFEAFQRQHKDYEGTGIGLTTVQRIIQRHGGRVWAEGEVNKGATFYFSLNRKK